MLLYFFYGYSSFLITLIFLFTLYCYFSETALLPAHDILVLQALTLPTSFFFSIFQRPFRTALLTKFPALYSDAVKKKETYPFYFLLKAILEPMLQGFLVFFITGYTVVDSLTNDGQPGDFKLLSLIIFISVFAIVNIKVRRRDL